MTNKIVILQNSVELYEHYINDEKWEKTLSFPKGGLTYNISNGTIKFFAFEDYLYRNCLMSMQLPIYIVNEKDGIDDEYSDIGEIVDILDEIFPTNDIDAELEGYLTKREAELTYQPIGDYVTTYELDEVLDDYYTKDETDDLLDGKADKDDVYTKDEADSRFQPIGDYVSADTFTAYTAQTDAELDGKADKDDVYTKTQADDKFQGKLIAGDNITITSGNVISAVGGGEIVDAYTKEESDELFQRRGDYITNTELENILDDYTTKQWVLNKNYVTQSSLNVYITNLQEEINSLQEALETCCSYHPTGETIYRWITLTGSDDYICSGTTKYEKQQEQQSTDNGITWTNVVPEQFRRGSVIEYSSVDCGAEPPITDRRWVKIPNEYMCKTDANNDHCKYEVMKLQYSYDNGATWVDSNPLKTTNGTLIECKSYDCGYDGCKYSCEAKLSGDSTVYHPATWVGYSNGVLNDYTTHQGWLSTHNSTLTYLKFNECVTSVANNAFYIKGYSAIEYMDIPSTVVSIGHSAFNIGTSTKFKTMVVRSVFPPQLSDYEDHLDSHGTEGPTFKSYNRNFKIYVPDESLETYKNTPRWSNYRDILYPISQLL